MRFHSALERGRLLQRYKRFLADVALDSGETVTASCPNTGSMLGLTAPGSRVWLSRSSSPTRKYAHTWEMVEADLGDGPALVGINTGHPNKLVAEAIASSRIKALTGYADTAARGEIRRGEPHRHPARGRAQGALLCRGQERAPDAASRALPSFPTA